MLFLLNTESISPPHHFPHRLYSTISRVSTCRTLRRRRPMVTFPPRRPHCRAPTQEACTSTLCSRYARACVCVRVLYLRIFVWCAENTCASVNVSLPPQHRPHAAHICCIRLLLLQCSRDLTFPPPPPPRTHVLASLLTTLAPCRYAQNWSAPAGKGAGQAPRRKPVPIMKPPQE